MMQMGFGMGGIEDQIIECAREITQRFNSVTYIEIGVGEGATLSAIASTLKESGKQWRAIGVELPNGYSFDRQKTIDWAKARDVTLNFVSPNGAIVHPAWSAVTVYFKDSQSFLTELWQAPIQFAMIDGCHGKPCVMLDFLALEAFMQKNSIIMFHDFDEDQRGHYQPHCPTGLDVMGAVAELGLMSGRRSGWQFVKKMNANRVKGGWDMGLFEKTTN